MPDTVPIVGLAAMVALALIAKEMKFTLTSTSLLVMTGVLAAWLAGLYLVVG
jgi:hypothetical protein